jgi:hypothetical protein
MQMFDSREHLLLSEVSALLAPSSAVQPYRGGNIGDGTPPPAAVARNDASTGGLRRKGQWATAGHSSNLTFISSPATEAPPPQFLDVSEIRSNVIAAQATTSIAPSSPASFSGYAYQPPGAADGLLHHQLQQQQPEERMTLEELTHMPIPNPECDAILALIARAGANVQLCEIDTIARRLRQQEMDEIAKAIELLEAERSYLKRRCGLLYSSINDVKERHARLIDVVTPTLRGFEDPLPSAFGGDAPSQGGGSNPAQQLRGGGGGGGAASSKGGGGGAASMARSHQSRSGAHGVAGGAVPAGAVSSSSATTPFPMPIASGPLSKATVESHYALAAEAAKRLNQR